MQNTPFIAPTTGPVTETVSESTETLGLLELNDTTSTEVPMTTPELQTSSDNLTSSMTDDSLLVVSSTEAYTFSTTNIDKESKGCQRLFKTVALCNLS